LGSGNSLNDYNVLDEYDVPNRNAEKKYVADELICKLIGKAQPPSLIDVNILLSLISADMKTFRRSIFKND